MIDLKPLLLRKMAWDIIPCNAVELYWDKLGLTPSSDECSELEHTESHSRLNQIAPLVNYVEIYAALIAQVVTALMVPDEDAPEDGELMEDSRYQAMEVQNREVLRSGLYAGLAQLFDTGIITYGAVL